MSFWYVACMWRCSRKPSFFSCLTNSSCVCRARLCLCAAPLPAQPPTTPVAAANQHWMSAQLVSGHAPLASAPASSNTSANPAVAALAPIRRRSGPVAVVAPSANAGNANAVAAGVGELAGPQQLVALQQQVQQQQQLLQHMQQQLNTLSTALLSVVGGGVGGINNNNNSSLLSPPLLALTQQQLLAQQFLLQQQQQQQSTMPFVASMPNQRQPQPSMQAPTQIDRRFSVTPAIRSTTSAPATSTSNDVNATNDDGFEGNFNDDAHADDVGVLTLDDNATAPTAQQQQQQQLAQSQQQTPHAAHQPRRLLVQPPPTDGLTLLQMAAAHSPLRNYLFSANSIFRHGGGLRVLSMHMAPGERFVSNKVSAEVKVRCKENIFSICDTYMS